MIVTLTDKSVNNVILRRKRLKIKVTNFPLLKKRDPNKDPKYPSHLSFSLRSYLAHSVVSRLVIAIPLLSYRLSRQPLFSLQRGRHSCHDRKNTSAYLRDH
ncbi:hypothetical protein MGAS11027_1640 [Streptococcus pyogenes]|nr:hypothetical protein MGAS11027_1640 [Streptococcus pyogenes]ANC27829.1 hypothetical protein MGAS27061_1584 [Streptococcus pyogenes]